MRVARSKNADGPYLDINNDVSLMAVMVATNLPENYEFTGAIGYAALGHNSVIKVDNKYIVIYHTRYKQGLVMLLVIITWWLINYYLIKKDGQSYHPSRYAGETSKSIKRGDIIGDYDIIIHSGETIRIYSF